MNKMEGHLCDNCRKEWEATELRPIKDLSSRVEPGGLVPSGECPECSALCYPMFCDAVFVTFTSQGHIYDVYGPPWLNFITIDERLKCDFDLRVHMLAREKLLNAAKNSGRVASFMNRAKPNQSVIINDFHKDPTLR